MIASFIYWTRDIKFQRFARWKKEEVVEEEEEEEEEEDGWSNVDWLTFQLAQNKGKKIFFTVKQKKERINSTSENEKQNRKTRENLLKFQARRRNDVVFGFLTTLLLFVVAESSFLVSFLRLFISFLFVSFLFFGL